MSVLDDVITTAKTVAGQAGKKTEELMTFSKLKIASMNTNADLSKAYQRLGVIVYDAKKNGLVVDEVIDSCMEEIDELRAKLDDLNDKLDEMKKQKVCPHCGTKNNVEQVYCGGCGSKLADE